MSIARLLKLKRRKILGIARKYGIRNIKVFGSVARRQTTKKSDIDLLVDTAPDRSLLDRVAFMQDLQDLLDRKVDVVTTRSLHWYIRDKVMNEAVPL